jgi:Xaa-Pro aminopeptidase
LTDAGGGAEAPTIPAPEFADRRRRAAEAAADQGLGGLVVWSRGGTSVDWYGDVMYLANHHSPFAQIPDSPKWSNRGHAAVVLPVAGEATLVTDTLEDPDDLPRIEHAVASANVVGTVAEVVRASGMAKRPVGIVGRETLLARAHAELAERLGPEVELRWADDLLEGLRVIKSDSELAMMRHAARVGGEWMRRTLEAAEPGRTEADVVAAGLAYLTAHGGYPYDVAIASGPRSSRYWGSFAIPHWNCERRLAEGDLLHCDLWGPVRGYLSDITRSTVVGAAATDAQRDVLEGAVALIAHIIAAMRPGVTFSELYAHGAAWLAEHEFAAHVSGAGEAGHAFGEIFPAFGHSLGLGIENPAIVAGDDRTLEPGMVVAVEGMVGRPHTGAAGHEDVAIVTADGVEVITSGCPARWWT